MQYTRLTSRLSKSEIRIVFAYSLSTRRDRNLKSSLDDYLNAIDASLKPKLELIWLNLEEDRGERIEQEIDIVAPLITPNLLFYDSFIKHVDLLRERHKIRVVPIILRATPNWESYFNYLQPLPRSGKAIGDSYDKDSLFGEVIEGLQETVFDCKEYRKNCFEYYQAFLNAIQQEYPLSPISLEDLRMIQEKFFLRNEDIEEIEAEIYDLKEQEIAWQERYEAILQATFYVVQRIKEIAPICLLFASVFLGSLGFGIFVLPRFKASADDFLRKGKTAYENKDFAKAIEEYSQAIKLEPKNFTYYNDRGNAYYFVGNFQAAIDDYTRAIDLNPENLHGYRYRGEARLKLGEYAEGAIADLKKAAILYQKDGDLQGYQSTMDILQQIQQ